jgi:hypothetical protein
MAGTSALPAGQNVKYADYDLSADITTKLFYPKDSYRKKETLVERIKEMKR